MKVNGKPNKSNDRLFSLRVAVRWATRERDEGEEGTHGDGSTEAE